MIINCDYCGASIDINKYKICPHCGASFNEDQEYQTFKEREEQIEELKFKSLQETQEQQKKINELEIEKKKAENESQKYFNKRQEENEKYRKSISKTGKILKFLICIPIICSIIICILPERTTSDENVQTKTDIETIETPEIIEVAVSGGLNETLSTSKYSVTITELKEASAPWHWKPASGKMYVAFNFIVENISNEEILSDEQVYCEADGFLADSFRYSEDIYLSSKYLPAGTKITGYCCFEVPINTKEFTVKYGDYITFNIPNTLFKQGE